MKSGITIEDFIKELQKYPNQKAEINFMVNTINTDNEAYDINDCDCDLFQQDVEDIEVYDIFISRNEKESKTQDKRRFESISYLLDEHGKINITLDKNSKDSIVITNDNNEVLREIRVDGEFNQEDNICKMLMFHI